MPKKLPSRRLALVALTAAVVLGLGTIRGGTALAQMPSQATPLPASSDFAQFAGTYDEYPIGVPSFLSSQGSSTIEEYLVSFDGVGYPRYGIRTIISSDGTLVRRFTTMRGPFPVEQRFTIVSVESNGPHDRPRLIAKWDDTNGGVLFVEPGDTPGVVFWAWSNQDTWHGACTADSASACITPPIAPFASLNFRHF